MNAPRMLAVLGIAVGVTLMGFAPAAWADGSGCRGERPPMMHKAMHGMHGHGMAGHMLRQLMKQKRDLGLTDEQIGKLRGLALESDRAAIRAEADVMVAERELRALLWDETAEWNAIETKVKERESLEATVRLIGIKARRDFKSVLTPEQREKMNALRERHGERHSQFMQRSEAGGIGEADQPGDDRTAELDYDEAGLETPAG